MMRKTALPLWVLVFAVLLPNGLQAADSSTALPSTGLIFGDNDHLKTERVTLTISPTMIRHHYTLRNISDRPATVRITFPLPDIPVELALYGALSFPVYGDINFVGFKTLVDNQAVKAIAERKIYSGDKDITGDYLQNGLPDTFSAPHFSQLLNSEYKYALLTKFGAFGKPGTVQKTRFHWLQSFPPRQQVEIQHRYQPMAGITPVWDSEARSFAQKKWKDKYCLSEESIAKIIDDFRAIEDKDFLTSALEIEYIRPDGTDSASAANGFDLHVISDGNYRYAAMCMPDGRTGSFGKKLNALAKHFKPNSALNILFLGAFH